LIKDYDIGINYHPRKANVVAVALSRKEYCNATFARRMQPELQRESEYLNLGMVNESKVIMEVEPTLEGQLEDTKLKEIQQLIRDNMTSDFSEDSQGILWLGKWICVPNLKHIKELILREAHDSAYAIHPGSTKMYKDLKMRYWWYGMKRDWWLRSKKLVSKPHHHAFDSLVLCVVWNIWLHRNTCVSHQAIAMPLTVIDSVWVAVDLWIRAGPLVGS
jgi:hypothetical protein